MNDHHIESCCEARNGGWPLMYRLSERQQQAILDCPDATHDSVGDFLRGKPWRPPWLTVPT